MITNAFVRLISDSLKSRALSAHAYGKVPGGQLVTLDGQLLVSPTAKENKIQFVLSFDTSQLPVSMKKIRITTIKILNKTDILVDQQVQFLLRTGTDIAQIIKMTITIS